VDERERRLAENEAVFRHLNDQIERQAEKHGVDSHVYDFLCECANVDCTLRLTLTIDEYERVRAHPTRFIVAEGHDLPEVETVVERKQSHWIVEKQNGAAELVAALDERT
jgi:hypothetical protein